MHVAKAMPHWPDPGGIAVLITSALENRTQPKVFSKVLCELGASQLYQELDVGSGVASFG